MGPRNTSSTPLLHGINHRIILPLHLLIARVISVPVVILALSLVVRGWLSASVCSFDEPLIWGGRNILSAREVLRNGSVLDTTYELHESVSIRVEAGMEERSRTRMR